MAPQVSKPQVSKAAIAGGAAVCILAIILIGIFVGLGMRHKEPPGTTLLVAAAGKSLAADCSHDTEAMENLQTCMAGLVIYGYQDKQLNVTAAGAAVTYHKKKFEQSLLKAAGPAVAEHGCFKSNLESKLTMEGSDDEASGPFMPAVDLRPYPILPTVWSECSKSVKECWTSLNDEAEKCAAAGKAVGDAMGKAMLENALGTTSGDMGMHE